MSKRTPLDISFYFSPISAAIAFLVSLTIFFTPSEARYLKIFSIFLFVNLLSEILSNYEAWKGNNNIIVTNCIIAVDFVFYFYLFSQIVRRRRMKNILLGLVFAYPVLFIVNLLFIQGTETFNSMSYSLGSLLVIISCIYYFWELFQQTTSLNLSRQPAFWICCGLLFYYACSFPFYASTNFVHVLPRVILSNLLLIFELLSTFEYLSFTIAFLCRLRTRKSMSSL